MADRLPFLFKVWLAVMCGGILHMFLAWLMLRRTGIGAPEFQLFQGKPVARFIWRGTSFQLGWIPTGAFVKWDLENFARAPWRLRAGIPLIGPAVIAVGSLLLLSWHTGLLEIWQGFTQIINGAFHPISVGAAIIHRLFNSSLPLAMFIGVVWAKYVAFHLLPLPVLPGGTWWTECFRRADRREPLELIQTGGALVAMAVWVSWSIAIGYFALQPLLAYLIAEATVN